MSINNPADIVMQMRPHAQSILRPCCAGMSSATADSTRKHRNDKNSHGSPYVIQNSLCYVPPLCVAFVPPRIEFSSNAVYQLLFLAGLGEVCAALVVKADKNLLQTVDGVELDVVPYSLQRIRGGGALNLGTNHNARGYWRTYIEICPRIHCCHP